MRTRGLFRRRGARGLGIVFLILSLGHTPLPQPDFHNIRHHDGPGQVCDHHDHLLRWHPGAGVARDVAILHWHWFLPTSDPSGPPSDDRPALHAHVADWFASTWDDGPRVVPGTHSQPISRAATLAWTAPCLDLPAALGAPAVRGPCPFTPPGATAAPGVRLTSLLHRWLC
jgi:hypothetical protein